jgi:hypothetical protein
MDKDLLFLKWDIKVIINNQVMEDTTKILIKIKMFILIIIHIIIMLNNHIIINQIINNIIHMHIIK